MRRRLRATCEQPAKTRSGGVVRIVMQWISITDYARKSAGIPRIERKQCRKALMRMGRDHFCFPKSGADHAWVARDGQGDRTQLETERAATNPRSRRSAHPLCGSEYASQDRLPVSTAAQSFPLSWRRPGPN